MNLAVVLEGSQLKLAEELFLRAFDEEKGKDQTDWGVDPGLAGALLIELAAQGCIEVRAEGVVVADCSSPQEPLLAEALNRLRASEREHDAKYWVAELSSLRPMGGGWTLPGRGLKRRVAERLVERGVLVERRRDLLGLIPRRRYPEEEPGPERRLRDRLEPVLLGDTEPDPRTAVLISLLRPLDLVKKLVPKGRRKEAKRRAEEVADSGIVAAAVGDRVREMQRLATPIGGGL